MATAKPITDAFYASYCAALDSLCEQGPRTIVVALGGGADSQSVLDLTLRYRTEHPQHEYLAIHLDHYFHPDSPKWAAFLKRQCELHEIPHIVEPIEVSIQGRQSKEAQGRDARYRRLAQLTAEHAIILLGHHLSDQSETFLLQLKRGSGPKGLASMAQFAPFVGERVLCRPLLAHSKADIYAYADARQLQWIEDDTNTDTRIERNFLRHDILPLLVKRWPQFEHTLARSARLCAEQQGLLEELLSEDLLSRMEYQTLCVRGLSEYSKPRQRALLRLFLAKVNAPMPSAAQLEQVIQQLAQRRVQVRFGAQQLCSFAEKLYLLPVFSDVADFRVTVTLDSQQQSFAIELPDDLGVLQFTHGEQVLHVPLDDAPLVLNIGVVLPGDTFSRRVGGQQHRLIPLMKKRRVAPWWRTRWPCLRVDGELIWVAELGFNQQESNTTPTAGAAAALQQWQITWQKGSKAPASHACQDLRNWATAKL